MVELGFAHGINSGLIFVSTGLRTIIPTFRVYIRRVNTTGRYPATKLDTSKAFFPFVQPAYNLGNYATLSA